MYRIAGYFQGLCNFHEFAPIKKVIFTNLCNTFEGFIFREFGLYHEILDINSLKISSYTVSIACTVDLIQVCLNIPC